MNQHRNIKVKVCGITREGDLVQALALGVDYVGINLWEKSLRSVEFNIAKNLLSTIPEGKRVLVDVATDPLVLEKYEPYFDFFQIHFPYDIEVEQVKHWVDIVGGHRLWLAPKMPPEINYPDILLDMVDTLLVDTYEKEGFGGSGQTGNWSHFASLEDKYPEKTWILAGGLNADNILDALQASKAKIVDVNSGVEIGPGIKCAKKLELLIDRVATL